jgi:hypothetical protein
MISRGWADEHVSLLGRDDAVPYPSQFPHKGLKSLRPMSWSARRCIPRESLYLGFRHHKLRVREPTSSPPSTVSHLPLSYIQYVSLTHLLHGYSEFGVVPISTLAQWTDVLHLSDKWGFMSLRAAAIKAILPLASSVDKIVLGKQYGFEEWLAPAYTDLVTREKRLTKEEASRLGLDVVLAVHEGRERARPIARSVDPSPAIDDLIHELFLAQLEETDDSSPKNDDRSCNQTSTPSAAVTGALAAEDQQKLARWAGQSLVQASATTGRTQILSHLQDHPSHTSAAVVSVLDAFWTSHCTFWKQRFQCGPYPAYITYNTGYLDNHHEEVNKMFNALKRCTLASQFSEILKTFCLNKLDSWTQLFDAPFDLDEESVITAYNTQSYVDHGPQAFIDMATAVHCTRYLLDQDLIDSAMLSKSVFASFWSKLILLCNQMWTTKIPYIGNRLKHVIGIMNGCVFTNAACKEIEAFYDHVETLCHDNESSVDYTHKQAIADIRVSHSSLGTR